MSKIKKIKVNNVEYDLGVDYTNVDNTPTIPSATSDLTNDSGFITKSVNDLTNYELKTDVGHSLNVSIDTNTYVMTLQLKNSANEVLSTQEVDLPLETMVIGASYDNTTKAIILTLKNGTTTRVSVADLVSGLQAEITSTNKLNSDLVDDTNSTNLFVTSAEKTTWNGKQDELTAGDNITILNNVISATGGGSGTESDVHFIKENSQENPFIFSENSVGIYMINWNGTDVRQTNFYYKFTPQDNIEMLSVSSNASITYDKDINATYDTQTNFAILFNYKFNYQNITCNRIKFIKNTNGTFSTQSQNDEYNLANLNYLNQAQTITSKKTFTVLPESSVVPTTSNQLVNKKYVDDNIPSPTQYETMPTASETTVGKIVQYTGTTDANYTNGYFYVGTSDGQEPATYSWENINVQDSGSNNENVYYINIDDYSINNPFILEEHPLGKYLLYNSTGSINYQGKNWYVKPTNDGQIASFFVNNTTIFDYTKDTSSAVYGNTIGSFTSIYIYDTDFQKPYLDTGTIGIATNSPKSISSYRTKTYYITQNSQEITGQKTFTTLPESSVTPTTNNQLVNKKYVDDKPTTYTGYDATKTQVLKNINGTLTWVDES